MFSLFSPWPFLVRTQEKSRRLKQNKHEQGKMIFDYFGGNLAGVNCSLVLIQLWQPTLRERHLLFPPSIPRLLPLCTGKGSPLCKGMLSPETDPNCCIVL